MKQCERRTMTPGAVETATPTISLMRLNALNSDHVHIPKESREQEYNLRNFVVALPNVRKEDTRDVLNELGCHRVLI